MSKRKLQIAEPSFEEDTLIRECAPVPELSAGFRSRVLSDCVTTLAASRRAFRMKIAGSVAAVCCLTLLLAVILPQMIPTTSGPTIATPTTPSVPDFAPSYSAAEYQPGSSPSGSSSGNSLAVDRAGSQKNSDSTQMNDMIEDLTDRQKIFDANMLPQF